MEQGSLEAAAQGLKRRASAMSAEQSEDEAGAGGPPKLARRPRSQRPSREPRPVQRDMLDDLDPGAICFPEHMPSRYISRLCCLHHQGG